MQQGAQEQGREVVYADVCLAHVVGEDAAHDPERVGAASL